MEKNVIITKEIKWKTKEIADLIYEFIHKTKENNIAISDKWEFDKTTRLNKIIAFLNIIEDLNHYLKNKDDLCSLKKMVEECYPIIFNEFGLSQQKGKTIMFDKIKENLPNNSIFSNELKHFEKFIKNINLIIEIFKSPTESLTNDLRKDQNSFNILSRKEKKLYITTLIDTYKMFFNFALITKSCNFSIII